MQASFVAKLDMAGMLVSVENVTMGLESLPDLQRYPSSGQFVLSLSNHFFVQIGMRKDQRFHFRL